MGESVLNVLVTQHPYVVQPLGQVNSRVWFSYCGVTLDARDSLLHLGDGEGASSRASPPSPRTFEHEMLTRVLQMKLLLEVSSSTAELSKTDKVVYDAEIGNSETSRSRCMVSSTDAMTSLQMSWKAAEENLL
jgi:hypothetical protein